MKLTAIKPIESSLEKLITEVDFNLNHAHNNPTVEDRNVLREMRMQISQLSDKIMELKLVSNSSGARITQELNNVLHRIYPGWAGFFHITASESRLFVEFSTSIMGITFEENPAHEEDYDQPQYLNQSEYNRFEAFQDRMYRNPDNSYLADQLIQFRRGLIFVQMEEIFFQDTTGFVLSFSFNKKFAHPHSVEQNCYELAQVLNRLLVHLGQEIRGN